MNKSQRDQLISNFPLKTKWLSFYVNIVSYVLLALLCFGFLRTLLQIPGFVHANLPFAFYLGYVVSSLFFCLRFIASLYSVIYFRSLSFKGYIWNMVLLWLLFFRLIFLIVTEPDPAKQLHPIIIGGFVSQRGWSLVPSSLCLRRIKI